MNEATSSSSDEALSTLAPQEILGTISYGQTIGAVSYQSAPGDHYRAWSFSGHKGDPITAVVSSPSGGSPRVWLLADSFATIETGKYPSGTTSSTLKWTLAADGTYYVAFRDVNLAPGTFDVELEGPSPDGGVGDGGASGASPFLGAHECAD